MCVFFFKGEKLSASGCVYGGRKGGAYTFTLPSSYLIGRHYEMLKHQSHIVPQDGEEVFFMRQTVI